MLKRTAHESFFFRNAFAGIYMAKRVLKITLKIYGRMKVSKIGCWQPKVVILAKVSASIEHENREIGKSPVFNTFPVIHIFQLHYRYFPCTFLPMQRMVAY